MDTDTLQLTEEPEAWVGSAILLKTRLVGTGHRFHLLRAAVHLVRVPSPFPPCPSCARGTTLLTPAVSMTAEASASVDPALLT